MNKLIARLIACGMPAKVALTMLRRFRTQRDREMYVEQIEEASREQLETV